MPIKHKPIPALSQKHITRFWSKVAIAGPDECWTWLMSKPGAGYGRFSFKHLPYNAHRVAYFLSYGKDPMEFGVLHNCPNGDNPSCCNPAHLWLGTPAENSADMARKGRSVKGSKTPPDRILRGERITTSKLTESAVREILVRYAAGGVSQRTLARVYGVTKTAVRLIINRTNWKHVIP